MHWIITIIIISLYVYIYIGIGQWRWRICQADLCFFQNGVKFIGRRQGEGISSPKMLGWCDLTIKSTVFENRDGVSKKLDILSTMDGDVELTMIYLCITKNWWTLSPSSSAKINSPRWLGIHQQYIGITTVSHQNFGFISTAWHLRSFTNWLIRLEMVSGIPVVDSSVIRCSEFPSGNQTSRENPRVHDLVRWISRSIHHLVQKFPATFDRWRTGG